MGVGCFGSLPGRMPDGFLLESDVFRARTRSVLEEILACLGAIVDGVE